MTKINTKIAGISAITFSIIAVSLITGFGQPGLASADDGDEIELIAVLFDINGIKAGEVKYELEDDKSELKIEIKDFESNGVFVVMTDSTQIGLVATDSDGEGELNFEPSPVMLNNGSSVIIQSDNVTVLSGTFEADTDEDDDDEED